MSDSFRRFPPRRGELLVPTSGRREALAALALYPACRPSAAAAQRAARALVRLLGPRALPGGAAAWSPPIPPDAWAALEARWRSALGPWDAVAILGRAQAERDGVSLLLVAAGAPRAFVKLRRDGAALARERVALAAAGALASSAFRAPLPLAAGEEGSWSWLASSALPARVHRRPRRPPVDAIVAGVDAALAGLVRPPGTPADWRPMHGDFTPWNLRAMDGELWLLDWEESGWGPPGADRVLYRAAEAALAGRAPVPAGPGDRAAVAFWRRRVAGRGGAERDRRLAAGLDAALAAMDADAPAPAGERASARYQTARAGER